MLEENTCCCIFFSSRGALKRSPALIQQCGMRPGCTRLCSNKEGLLSTMEAKQN